MKPTRDEQAFAELLDGLRQDAPSDMARFARLAVALEHVRPSPTPTPDFRNALRNRLIAEATAGVSWFDRAAEAWTERNAALRRNFKMVFATAVAAIVLLAGGSVFALARNAVPGDWDYFAKRLHENARLVITREPVARAFLEIDFARERLDEVRILVDRGQQSSNPYFVALNDMDARTLDATRLLVESFRQTHRIGPLNVLSQFATAQRHGLEVLIDRLPPAARPPARDSIDILQRVSDRVVGIMGGCPCPANPLLPQVSPETGSPVVPGVPGQAPVCDCTRIRGEGGTDQPVAGGPAPNHRKPKPNPGPATPPPDGTVDGTIDTVVGTVNGTTTDVNKVIDDALKNVPLPVPTVSVSVPTVKDVRDLGL
jgi:hypothetical protein